ncbi:MAG: hypothetical protein BM560_19525 [Roseobacter sp. MedPE-SWde]|nr:MAG: hypothetical protein BM560_19525 [Roseobacter sp. MedPE-SWde]
MGEGALAIALLMSMLPLVFGAKQSIPYWRLFHFPKNAEGQRLELLTEERRIKQQEKASFSFEVSGRREKL